MKMMAVGIVGEAVGAAHPAFCDGLGWASPK